jgi:threonine/homoserine/homoserine lactone efflux protein
MPVDPALLLAFLLAATVLVLIPGPDTVFVLAQTIAGGRTRGWAAVGGIMTGALLQVALAAAGVAALLAASPGLFAALQALGGAYLLWLGLGLLRAALRGGGAVLLGQPAAAAAPAPPTRLLAYWQGLVTNLMNPKAVLFFLAFLPQFVAPDRAPAWVQMLILGPLVPLMALPYFAAVILGADRARACLLSRAAGGGAAVRWLEGIAGGLFLALGLRLVLAAAPR